MKKLGPSMRRSVAAVTLPFVMSACMTWQQQDVASLRDVIIRDQPDRVRLRTRSEGEFDLEDPRVFGDTISGYGSTGVVAVPLADVAAASVSKKERLGPGMLLAVLGTAGMVYLVIGAASISGGLWDN